MFLGTFHAVGPVAVAENRECEARRKCACPATYGILLLDSVVETVTKRLPQYVGKFAVRDQHAVDRRPQHSGLITVKNEMEEGPFWYQDDIFGL